MLRSAAALTYKAAKRIVIFTVGVTVIVIGVIMIVTPGPAVVMIPLGLAILSIEFAWARRWLAHVRQRISDTTAGNRARRAEKQRERVQYGDDDGNPGAEKK